MEKVTPWDHCRSPAAAWEGRLRRPRTSETAVRRRKALLGVSQGVDEVSAKHGEILGPLR